MMSHQLAQSMPSVGSLYLWGANEMGQCALPPKRPPEVDAPVRSKALAHTVIRFVACGASHAVAVDLGGHAYSWGSALYGQLGSMSPPKTFAPPPAIDPKDQGAGSSGKFFQPMLIQSVSRLHIVRAACGLHHSLLLSEQPSSAGQHGRQQRSLLGSPSGVSAAELQQEEGGQHGRA